MDADALTTAATLPVDHPTASLYLDESGILTRSEFFGIGLLRACDVSKLLEQFRGLCHDAKLKGELHWADFDKAASTEDALELAKRAIDLVFDSDGFSFSCLIADRRKADVTAQFKNHRHAAELAYEHVAAEALFREVENNPCLVSVIADAKSTHADVHFERDVRAKVNTRAGRLAIVTVDRMDSRACPGLQLIDLLLGAAAYDLRTEHPDEKAQKRQISLHLLERMGCNSVRPHGRIDPDGNFRVQLLGKSDPARRKKRGGARAPKDA